MEIIDFIDELSVEVHQKYLMNHIIQKFYTIGEKLILPCCYIQCLVELMKEWMIVIKYAGGWIENMEWVESYKYCIQRVKTALAFRLPNMFDGIDTAMNNRGELWRWVNQKYGMGRIIWKLHSV